MKKSLLLVLAVLLMLSVTGFACAASNSDVMFAENTYNVFEGDTLELDLLTQGDAFGGSVSWKSNNMKTATVNDGLVTGLRKGSVTITATVSNNGKSWKAACKVNVLRPATGITVKTADWNLVRAEDVSLGDLVPVDNELPILLMVPGGKVSISAAVTPKDASSTKAVVTSSDLNVLSVSNSAAKAIAPGSAVLTVASEVSPEIFQEYLVVVLTPVTSITVSGENTVFVGSSTCLTADCYPANADLTEVTWTSASNRIATVDEYGVVYGVAKGSTTITATAKDGSKTSRAFKVTVSVAPTSMVIKQNGKTLTDGSIINLNVSAKTSLSAAVQPASVTDKSVNWYSSNESVATVTSRGQVTGMGVGTAIITAESSLMGDVRASITLRVVQPVTKVEAYRSSVEFYAGETYEIGDNWIVSPSTATVQELTFKSSDTRVATVDQYGTVYGVGGGKATITATATDGSRKSGKMTVTVIQPVQGVHMQKDTYRVGVNETIALKAIVEPADATNKRMSWSVEDATLARFTSHKDSANPRITGLAWGTTMVYGTTEDGGYTTQCVVNVGNLDKALEIFDVRIQNNEVYFNVQNVSNLTINRFTYQVQVFDMFDNPLPCSTKGTNTYTGRYTHTLRPGEVTKHSRFDMGDWAYPNGILGRIVVTITGYAESTGDSHDIKAANRTYVEYTAPGWVKPEPIVPEDESTGTGEGV